MADSATALQCALNAVKTYCDKSSLKVNGSKTKVLIFSRGKVRNIPKFYYDGDELGVDFDFSYLGVTFNYNGKFHKSIKNLVERGQRALFKLLVKGQSLQLPVDIMCELFERTVIPVITYGCEVWGFSKIEQLEVFQRRFIRRILMLPKGTDCCMLYSDTGL